MSLQHLSQKALLRLLHTVEQFVAWNILSFSHAAHAVVRAVSMGTGGDEVKIIWISPTKKKQQYNTIRLYFNVAIKVGNKGLNEIKLKGDWGGKKHDRKKADEK